jgi:hypothetical protein
MVASHEKSSLLAISYPELTLGINHEIFSLQKWITRNHSKLPTCAKPGGIAVLVIK